MTASPWAIRRRLVYGGHTIGLAQASLCRCFPGTAAVLGWQACDHPAPVFEEDVLTFHHTLLAERPSGSGRLRALRVEVPNPITRTVRLGSHHMNAGCNANARSRGASKVDAERSDGSTEFVLDWVLVTWGA
jgi:hypothetical protein